MLAAALVLVVGMSVPVLERGDTCVLKSPLSLSVKGRSGTLESTIERGTQVEVVGVSDGGSARIRAGDLKGDVSLADLEGACSGSLRMCRLKGDVVMYEQNRSDSKSWRLKDGAQVSVLKKGKTWAAVRVGDLRGFVKSDEMAAACVPEAGSAPLSSGAGGGGGGGGGDGGLEGAQVSTVEEVERGEGPGVILLPFALEGAAPAGNADALFDTLYDRTAFYRPDAAKLALEEGAARAIDWKATVAVGARRATGAGTAYAIVGRVSLEPARPDKPLEDRHLLQLAVVEAKSGNVLKAIKIRPTLNVRDNWAEKALAALLPALAAAPNSKLPVLDAPLEVAPVKGATGADPNGSGAGAPDGGALTRKETRPVDEEPPSALANPWGWLTLGGAVALGAGSGIVAVLALDENNRANELSAADPTQAERRNTALTEAVTADALAVAAVGVGVASVLVFTTRAGMSE